MTAFSIFLFATDVVLTLLLLFFFGKQKWVRVVAAAVVSVLIVVEVWALHYQAAHGHGLGIWSWLINDQNITRDGKGVATQTAYRPPHIVTLAQAFLGILAALTVGAITIWQFLKKQKQEQEHFDRKEQEDRFKDIQDRFASPDARTRANAALRLAEMARLPKPGATNNPVCEENNPFFLRAAAPLAIALHMEENPSVRAANKEALANMVAWIKRKEKNDPLLRALIAKLYDANQTALRAFIKALAEYCNTQPGGKPDMNLLVTTAGFTYHGDAATKTLLSLMATTEFKADRDIHQKIHGFSSEDLGKAEGPFLTQVKLDAARLVDTRDALAIALCALSRSNGKPVIRLNNAFLANAQLSFAELDAVILDRAQLNRADLYFAQLNRAEFYRAELNYAKLKRAELVESELNGAELIGAELIGAVVENPDGTGKANFTGANWRDAKFTGRFDKNEDERLWKWLSDNYPYETDAEKAERAANATNGGDEPDGEGDGPLDEGDEAAE